VRFNHPALRKRPRKALPPRAQRCGRSLILLPIDQRLLSPLSYFRQQSEALTGTILM
jgi:hypothetical protein